MTVSEFLDTINLSNTKFKIETKQGISRIDITDIEMRLNVKLPDDLVDFYSLTNGLEGDDLIFKIIPLNEIDKSSDDAGEYLTFAEYMIYSETCELEIDKLDRNKYTFFIWTRNENDTKNIKRKYISNSIIDFIQLYCDKGTFGIFSHE